MNSPALKTSHETITLPLEQYNEAHLHLSIAKSFLQFLAQDMEREDSILQTMEKNQQQGLLCGISCLLDSGTDLLT